MCVCVCACVRVCMRACACVCITVTDYDECVNRRGLCGINAMCQNTDGSYMCLCTTGFSRVNGGPCSGMAAID